MSREEERFVEKRNYFVVHCLQFQCEVADEQRCFYFNALFRSLLVVINVTLVTAFNK